MKTASKLTLVLTASGLKVHVKNEKSPGWLKYFKKMFLNKKNSLKISAKLFVSGGFHKNVIFIELLMIHYTVRLKYTFLLSKSSGLQRAHLHRSCHNAVHSVG
jgi:hypothetical protein